MIPIDWQPGDYFWELLEQHNINRDFAIDQLPEFVLYWRERGEKRHQWGSKFLQHCVREWRRHEIAVAQRRAEVPMTSDWKPSQEALLILFGDGIPTQFTNDSIPEFRLYWMDRGVQCSTWDTKFITHVRHCWQRHKTLPRAPQPVLTHHQPERSWLSDNRGGSYDKGRR